MYSIPRYPISRSPVFITAETFCKSFFPASAYVPGTCLYLKLIEFFNGIIKHFTNTFIFALTVKHSRRTHPMTKRMTCKSICRYSRLGRIPVVCSCFFPSPITYSIVRRINIMHFIGWRK